MEGGYGGHGERENNQSKIYLRKFGCRQGGGKGFTSTYVTSSYIAVSILYNIRLLKSCYTTLVYNREQLQRPRRRRYPRLVFILGIGLAKGKCNNHPTVNTRLLSPSMLCMFKLNLYASAVEAEGRGKSGVGQASPLSSSDEVRERSWGLS
jgi:hypothetical protein